MQTLTELNKFNHVTFHEKDHNYFIGEQALISVTRVIAAFKEPFDRDGNALRVADKRGVPVVDVLAEWDLKKDISCEKGTLFHEYIECCLANKTYYYPEERIRKLFGEDPLHDAWNILVPMFQTFQRDSSKNLIPVKSEFVIGDSDLGIGGMIDQIFFNRKSGQLEIWDWKTNRAIQKNSSFGKKFLYPLENLDECEWNSYSLQLALYKLIIEKNTNLKLGNSYLAWFHEHNPSYRVIRCAPFENEVRMLLREFSLKGQKMQQGTKE